MATDHVLIALDGRWGPLSIDLLGSPGKLAMPFVVTSLSAAQVLSHQMALLIRAGP